MSVQNSVESVLSELINKVDVLESAEINQSMTLPTKCESVLTVESYSKSKIELNGNSSDLERCRICYDTNCAISIIYPCRCKGTIGAVHLNCLERWLQESNNDNCELCGYKFEVKRTPHYGVFRSLWIWLWLDEDEYQSQVQGLRMDLVRCGVVTPLIIVCTYMCLIATDFYSAINYKNFNFSSTWTSYSLLIMMSLLILFYFVWIIMTVQYHQKIWLNWWKKKSIVKIIFPDDNYRLNKHLSAKDS